MKVIKKIMIISFIILLLLVISSSFFMRFMTPGVNLPLFGDAPGCRRNPISKYLMGGGMSRNTIKNFRVIDHPDPSCLTFSYNDSSIAKFEVDNDCPSDKKLVINNILITPGTKYFDFRRDSSGNIYNYVADAQFFKYPKEDQNIILNGEYAGKDFTIIYTLTKYQCGTENSDFNAF